MLAPTGKMEILPDPRHKVIHTYPITEDVNLCYRGGTASGVREEKISESLGKIKNRKRFC